LESKVEDFPLTLKQMLKASTQQVGQLS